jgi:hypothetical protein
VVSDGNYTTPTKRTRRGGTPISTDFRKMIRPWVRADRDRSCRLLGKRHVRRGSGVSCSAGAHRRPALGTVTWVACNARRAGRLREQDGEPSSAVLVHGSRHADG